MDICVKLGLLGQTVLEILVPFSSLHTNEDDWRDGRNDKWRFVKNAKMVHDDLQTTREQEIEPDLEYKLHCELGTRCAKRRQGLLFQILR